MAVADVSPWKAAKDSPSRQLLWELSRLALVEQEESLERLDQACRERGAVLKSALDEAAARHDKVRKDAEAEGARIEQERQQAKARREAEHRQQEERERQAEAERERAARQRAAVERAERAATQEREAEQARVKAEKDRQDAQKAKAKKEEDEAAGRRKAEEERKAKEAAVAAAARSTPRTQPALSTTGQPVASTSQRTRLDPEREKEHQRYLEIHKTLKELRHFMDQQSKQNPTLKAKMGDMRRGLRKSVGQLREGRGANIKQNKAIWDTLGEALTSFPEPKISLASLIARPIQDVQAPALFVYLLNHFAKAVIAQFIKEAAVSPTIADPIGTATVNVFAKDEHLVNGISLIDILIAKFHRVCPPLFGIYGSESTDQGRERLGWWRDQSGGPWVPTQMHQDRMTGLGAGYAAISLRNFENSRMTNPYPPYHYWRTLTGILNVPAGKVTDTHLVLLRALLANSESRFLMAYGESAKQLMQFAVNEYPKRAAKDSVAATLLSNLGNTWKKDKKLYL
ncbi:MAG: hypothetical protein L6R38_009124 [Xanthoria sp. 2 TBL-2021]|nr:MAG: hypothetical protein L6R38_009124 [Xanthoria sp. 2 TBL-2021]